MSTKDTWSLGGHEFTSRFILGSGKFSLDLVKACIEKADAQIITLALRRANEGGACQYFGLHSGECNPASEHIRSEKCPGGSANRQIIKRSGMWGFCKDRSCTRFQIFVTG